MQKYWSGIAAVCWSCASQLRLATVIEMPKEPVPADQVGAVIVAFPPPPAKVEVVPASPADPNCVWLDGQWAYSGQDYVWLPGAWLKRLSGCAFAKSRLFWDDAAVGPAILRYRVGRWVIPSPPYTECPAPEPCNPTGL